ncbi:MAG: hypothetical protein EOP87_16205 [Verrucomicrobiaceae bacterium]|nr:MAG: hypothetical protein EOP87_16205 [Verrucomicrobiaceae bacterium]
MESFITTISRVIAEKGLPALMIGGHAVTALGHPRATFDLDLLIPRSSAESWRIELVSLRYRLFSESPNFQQYEASPDFPLPPVDLMLVDDNVFQVLETTKSSSAPIATPGVLAMIALKLHAIHQPAREDVEKDWADVIALAKANKLSLDDPEFSATVLRHGGEHAIRRIQASLIGGD